MFNDRYGLTQAVLEGKKTMTRRIIKGNYENVKAYHANGGWHFIADTDEGDSVELKPQYEIGEEVAIAQPYKNDDVLTYNAYNEDGTAREDGFQRHKEMLESKGYRNKMFVKAEYMPHRIRITGIKVERLQDINDEDCIKEGLLVGEQEPRMYGFRLPKGTVLSFLTPREAFAALIDRISGRGTWQSNPWVYAYTFELIFDYPQQYHQTWRG
jgi:hypothetical protein